jgi:hypothetical protein
MKYTFVIFRLSYPSIPPTPESHSPLQYQHHFLSGRRIPTSALPFIFDTKLAESAYQDILTGCQDSFDSFWWIFCGRIRFAL